MNEPTLESAQRGVKVMYIGNKPKKTDNVTGSEVTWSGFGDVQVVPVAAAVRLLVPKYAAIWQDGTKAPPAQEVRTKAAIEASRKAVEAHVKKEAQKPQRPINEEVRVPLEDIIDAVCGICESTDFELHLDEAGKPKLESVRAKMGKRISEKQLGEAWDSINSARA